MNIIDIAFYIGLILGSALLLGAMYVYIRRQIFGLGGVVLVVFGSFLIGLSIWTSFKVSVNADGSVSAEYKREAKEDLGAKAADLNGSIEQLKLRLVALDQDIAALKKVAPSATPPKAQVQKREAEEQRFSKNSPYSVLVFNKANQDTVGAQISNALLLAGFKSSSTQTTLAEALQQFPPNTARVLYTKRGQQKLAEIKDLLAKTTSNITYSYREDVVELRRGDIQILLF